MSEERRQYNLLQRNIQTTILEALWLKKIINQLYNNNKICKLRIDGN